MTLSIRHIRMFLPILAALLLAGPTFGQTADDLKKENDHLKTQVREMQKELDAAKVQISKLEQVIAQMQAQMANNSSGSTPPPPEPEVTIDESVPNASPRALYAAVVASHDEAMKDIEMGRPNDRQRTAYMRQLERWAAATSRELKSPIEWTVRIKEMATTRSGTTVATLIPIDPVSDAVLGEPFDVVLDNPIVRRLQPAIERGDVDKLVLAGVVNPTVHINPRRGDRGPFDSPKFVAPYVEFSYSVDARSLVPVEKKPEKPKSEPGKRGEDKPARSK